MTTIKRLSRMILGDVNHILDTLEDSRLSLKQVLVELENTKARTLSELTTLEANINDLDISRNRTLADMEKLQNYIDICLTNERQEIARSLVSTRLSLEGQRAELSDNIARVTARTEVKKRYIQELDETLIQVRNNLDILNAKSEAHTGCAPVQTFAKKQDDEIEAAFLHEIAKHTEKQSKSSATE